MVGDARKVRSSVAGTVLAVAACLAGTPTMGALSEVIVTKNVVYPTVQAVNAACPIGTHVGFGGFKTNANAQASTSVYAWPRALAPIGTDVRTWSVKIKDRTAARQAKVTSYAYCTGGSTPKVVRSTRIVTAFEPEPETSAVCPDGKTLIGGGFSADAEVIPLELHRSDGSPRTWVVKVVNSDNISFKLTAIAICGGGPLPTAFGAESDVVEQDWDGASATATCPVGKRVLFAGLRAEYDDVSGANALPTELRRPTGRTVRASAFHNYVGPTYHDVAKLQAIAYCR